MKDIRRKRKKREMDSLRETIVEIIVDWVLESKAKLGGDCGVLADKILSEIKKRKKEL